MLKDDFPFADNSDTSSFKESEKLCVVRYDFGNRSITINYSSEAMCRSIVSGTYEYTLKNLIDMKKVDECIRKSINLPNSHQSISVP